MIRFVFVTGGVVSSIGKGLLTASLASQLEARKLSVNILKMDPYINVDPGTMSPFQHGEVFVTADGAETDLDLGHYERFSTVKMTKKKQLYDRQYLRGGDSKRKKRRVPGGYRPGNPSYNRRDKAKNI